MPLLSALAVGASAVIDYHVPIDRLATFGGGVDALANVSLHESHLTLPWIRARREERGLGR